MAGKKEVEIQYPEYKYLDIVLEELDAKKYKENGTPCYELNLEYFKIGNQKICIRTEDGMFVYLEGPDLLVNKIQKKITKKIELEDACNQLSAPLQADT